MREHISKKLRFEIFKRDAFTCQYCGAKAPDVLLEVDHIQPVAKGGTSDILNLITSCKACNSGKSDRELSDNTVIEKQRAQLSELQERKEQIEMMVEWQQELSKLDDDTLDKLIKFWENLTQPYQLTEYGKKDLQRFLRQFSLEEVLEAMRISINQYIELGDNGKPSEESLEKAFEKIGGICMGRKYDQTNPTMKEIYYIRGILRKRLAYCDQTKALVLLKKCVKLGIQLDVLKELALEVKNWSSWITSMNDMIDQLENSNETG